MGTVNQHLWDTHTPWGLGQPYRDRIPTFVAKSWSKPLQFRAHNFWTIPEEAKQIDDMLGQSKLLQ